MEPAPTSSTPRRPRSSRPTGTPARDPDGSVTAYQYAIGTTAGGTRDRQLDHSGQRHHRDQDGLIAQQWTNLLLQRDGRGQPWQLAGFATNSNGQTVDIDAANARPANVRDGTGADIATAYSTTQLSANWDACTDTDSGISGYQYAIGTTAGGTKS